MSVGFGDMVGKGSGRVRDDGVVSVRSKVLKREVRWNGRKMEQLFSLPSQFSSDLTAR